MSAAPPGSSGNGGRRIAYRALLGTTALGTLSANMINAPLYVIQTELGMTSQQSVMAVSAFTIAMATVVPLAGWSSDRFGAKTLLVWALGVMVLAEIAAALAPGMETLIAARAVQGAACSAIPPCVLAALMSLRPERVAQNMGAWAAAIGLGQAIGPPFGGIVTEVLGWRNVFITHAALVLVMMVLLAVALPAAVRRRPPMHVSAMFWLVAGGGSMATAILLAGQGGPWAGVALLTTGAMGSWALFVHLCRQRARRAAKHAGTPGPLLDPALLRDPGFLTAAAGAGLAMVSLAVSIVAVPLFLASELDLGPAQIGLVVFTLALAMIVAGPAAGRMGRLRGTGAQLRRGVVLIVVAAPVVSVAMATPVLGVARWGVVSLVVLGLVMVGTGIAFTQSAAATGLVTSPAGRAGTAVGIHNMLRFLAMAVGYSAVSLAFATDASLLVFPAISLTGLAMLAALRASPGRPRRP